MGSDFYAVLDVVVRYPDDLSALTGLFCLVLTPVGRPKMAAILAILMCSSCRPILRPWDTREHLAQLGTAAARLWQPIEAMACTPAELMHVEPATLLEEILQTGVQVA